MTEHDAGMARPHAPSTPGPGGKDALEARLQASFAPIVAAAGFDLIAVRVTQAARTVLRLQVHIDRLPGQGGVGLGDCAKVSRKLSAALEADEPVADDFELEVSSPGMNRILRHADDYRRFAGITAKVTVLTPQGAKESVIGVLGDCDEHRLVLLLPGGKRREVPLTGIQKANLHPTMAEWQALGQRLAAERAALGEQPGDDEEDEAGPDEVADRDDDGSDPSDG